MIWSTDDELAELEDDIIHGFLGIMQHQAKLEGYDGSEQKWMNYFNLPDLVLQHINPATCEREVLVRGVPVLRTWREKGEVRARIIVGDWEPL